MTEVKRLIVNADDLGLHSLVNRAIFRAHREGIVTSTTILAGGAAFNEAVSGLTQHPDLGVGLHLCLVEQRPVSAPEKIPSLVDAEGRLFASHAVFIRKYLLRKISLADVRVELEAQAEKAANSGLILTHYDSHQHLHLLPGVASLVVEIGKKFGINRVRISADDAWAGLASTSWKRRLQGRLVSKLAAKRRRQFAQSGLISTDRFVGFSRGGCLFKSDWLGLIPKLHPGVTEIMVHPGENNVTLDSSTGWDYHWEEELEALIDPEIKSLLKEHGVQLINFGDLS